MTEPGEVSLRARQALEARPQPRCGTCVSQRAGSGGVWGLGHVFLWQVPPDATVVEMAILDLNQKAKRDPQRESSAQDLWEGQRLDAESLLALRCIPEERAIRTIRIDYRKLRRNRVWTYWDLSLPKAGRCCHQLPVGGTGKGAGSSKASEANTATAFAEQVKIRNPNDYVQAAVTKIIKEGCACAAASS